MKFGIGPSELQSSNLNNSNIASWQTWLTKKSVYITHFPDSGGSPDFVLHGNVQYALLSNIVYRKSFSGFKRKSQAF